MPKFPTPSFLENYLQNSFYLKQHLQEFLNLTPEILENKLIKKREEIQVLGHKDFDWKQVNAFYSEKIGELYLFELGAWHLESHEYIGDTLRLIADHAQGRVLDFGGGIGTHTIGAAMSPRVEQVIYCDLNPVNVNFVQYRAKKMGLAHKITCYQEMPTQEVFNTILCFDVLEHLPDPSQQLLKFYQALTAHGKIIMNWYFFKGFNQEFPFHLDEEKVIEHFFWTLQNKLLEVFHPYLITARCYRKHN